MKTKYINVLFSFVIASFMMSCSSEIPTGDANKFSDMKSPEEDMVKRDYLPLNHPCMLHTQADINRVKSNLNRSLGRKLMPNWKQANMRKVLILKTQELCLTDI